MLQLKGQRQNLFKLTEASQEREKDKVQTFYNTFATISHSFKAWVEHHAAESVASVPGAALLFADEDKKAENALSATEKEFGQFLKLER